MDGYFATYADALAAGDLARIEPHFAYPATLINQAGTDVVHGAEDLAQHLEGFLTQLKDWGVAAIDVEVKSTTKPTPSHATAHVAFVCKDAGGTEVAAFEYLYVLVKGGAGGWRIRLAELLDDA